MHGEEEEGKKMCVDNGTFVMHWHMQANTIIREDIWIYKENMINYDY